MTRRFDRALAAAQVQLVHARKTAKPSAVHAHELAMIFVPLSGSLKFQIDGAQVVADPQHALVVRAGVDHRHEPSTEVEYFIAYVPDALVEVADGAAPPVAKQLGGQIRLGKHDHEARCDLVSALPSHGRDHRQDRRQRRAAARAVLRARHRRGSIAAASRCRSPVASMAGWSARCASGT